QNPARRPSQESITAAAPFSCWATRPVPPRVLRPPADAPQTRYPVSGSASAQMSGTARPEAVPEVTAGLAVKVPVVRDGVRYVTARKVRVPDTACWYAGAGSDPLKPPPLPAAAPCAAVASVVPLTAARAGQR